MSEELTPFEFERQLGVIASNPAFSHIERWYSERLVRRILAAGNPVQAAADLSLSLQGASALLLAIQNAAHEVRKRNEGMTHDSSSQRRGRRAAQAAGPTAAGGDTAGAGGTGKQAAGEAGTV
jgi:hypothetical protein